MQSLQDLKKKIISNILNQLSSDQFQKYYQHFTEKKVSQWLEKKQVQPLFNSLKYLKEIVPEEQSKQFDQYIDKQLSNYKSNKQQQKNDKIKEERRIKREEKVKQQELKKQQEYVVKQIPFKHMENKVNNVDFHELRCEVNETNNKNYTLIINDNIQNIKNTLIKIQQQKNLPFKIQVTVLFETYEINQNNVRQYNINSYRSDQFIVNNIQSDLEQQLHNAKIGFDKTVEQTNSSGVIFNRILYVTIKAYQFIPQSVGSYIELKGLLKNKKCCKNIKNTNDYCSIYTFLLFYYEKVMGKKFKHFDRPQNYDFWFEGEYLVINLINREKINKKIKIGNVQFPCNLEDIKKIAKGFDFTFSLFEYQSVVQNGKEKILVRVIENQKTDKRPHIDLLMNNEKSEEKINYHVMLIKSFNRLMSDGSTNIKYYCKNCLNYFYDEQKQINHMKYCYEKENASTDIYPQSGKKIYFKNHFKQIELPVVITADFESTIEEQKDQQEFLEQEEIDNITTQCKTKKLAKHKIVSYGIQVYDKYNLLKKHYYEYVKQDENDNVIEKFLQQIKSIYIQVRYKIKNTNIPFEMTEELENQRQNSKLCYLCNLPYTKKNGPVIDHDHFTGEVRGIAHNNCNLHYHIKKSKIPVIFHNLKGYDSHLIIKQIGEFIQKQGDDKFQKISCIANNSEKFMSIEWNHVRFIDSLQFMPSSLDTLSKNLPIEKKIYTMQYLKERFGDKLNQQELEEILNKGLFPYSWFDSIEKLKQSKFPSQEAFYDDLNEKKVNIEEYKKSKELYKKLGFICFKEWLLLYQAIDVKLLTDIWINFRNQSLQYYKLDPGHYYTSPGLAWDAMLKLTNVKLDLISDPDMYLMFERQSRGGISTTGNIRYAKANNINCPDYDETKKYDQLLYFDANNLYGHSMIQKLPTGNFKQIKEEDFEKYSTDFILNYDNGDIGYLFESDMIYSQHLHDKHDAYPLAPEQKVIKYEEQSQYNKNAIDELLKNNNIKINMSEKNKKLTPNLENKKRYVCNINNLQLYLQQGLVLDKIHRIIQFDQSDFMKPYIELNTNLRQQAKNDFEKDFFKLMNNSVYGKTCENVRNRKNYELVYNQKRTQKIINSRYFKNLIKISDNLALVESYQKNVKLDKPSYIGMQILDLSKIVMYKYYYEHITKEFEKVDLVMTDTDSLFMKIECSKEYDVYDSMIKNNDLYDFSNVSKGLLNDKIVKYCEQNNLDVNEFKNKNKAVIGKMKNEVPNAEIIEAISLKSKCYAYKTSENKESKKNKGIKRNVVNNVLTLSDYKECVLNKQVKSIKQKTIRSYNHELFTIQQEKIALQYFNDKKYILDDGIRTLSYGNYRIQQQN